MVPPSAKLCLDDEAQVPTRPTQVSSGKTLTAAPRLLPLARLPIKWPPVDLPPFLPRLMSHFRLPHRATA